MLSTGWIHTSRYSDTTGDGVLRKRVPSPPSLHVSSTSFWESSITENLLLLITSWTEMGVVRDVSTDVQMLRLWFKPPVKASRQITGGKEKTPVRRVPYPDQVPPLFVKNHHPRNLNIPVPRSGWNRKVLRRFVTCLKSGIKVEGKVGKGLKRSHIPQLNYSGAEKKKEGTLHPG